MQNHNHDHASRWVAIIVCVLIASSGVSFGVIKSSGAKDTERHVARLDNQYIMIMELKTQSAVIEVELKNLNKQVEELNSILRNEYGIINKR